MRTAAIALLIALGVGASSFSLQAAGLRDVPQANTVAARAANWLLRYRFAASTLDLAGRTVHGRCYHGWFERRDERSARGTILLLDDGASVRVIEPRTLLAHGLHALRAISVLDLAGCTHVLGPQVASLAEFDNAVHLKKLLVLGQPEYALHFKHLTLLVSAKTDRPLGATLDGIASTFRLEHVTPRTARAMENA